MRWKQLLLDCLMAEQESSSDGDLDGDLDSDYGSGSESDAEDEETSLDSSSFVFLSVWGSANVCKRLPSSKNGGEKTGPQIVP